MAILHLNFHADTINRSVSPTVFLPDLNGWNDVNPPYKTLYFLHGYSGGGLETSHFTNFALYSMLYGIAIVMLDGENSFYIDNEKRGIMYSQYVGQEIVEVTRAMLPLSHKREDTFIGGISMGGFGAMINGLRFKDTFGKIVCLSPALGFKRPDDKLPANSPCHEGEILDIFGTWKEYVGTYKDPHASLLAALKEPNMPEIFVGCGRQDPLVYEYCHDFSKEMQSAGAPLTYWEIDGLHDHTFWKKALTPACEFLTGKKV